MLDLCIACVDLGDQVIYILTKHMSHLSHNTHGQSNIINNPSCKASNVWYIFLCRFCFAVIVVVLWKMASVFFLGYIVIHKLHLKQNKLYFHTIRTTLHNEWFSYKVGNRWFLSMILGTLMHAAIQHDLDCMITKEIDKVSTTLKKGTHKQPIMFTLNGNKQY